MARNRIIPIFVPHAGCPHQCVFCNQKRIAGDGTTLSAEAVSEQIREGLKVCGHGAELAFYGGSFTAIPAAQQELLLAAAAPFLKDGSLSSVRLSTRPDAINDEICERLVRFGVQTVELGSQSMDDRVLRESGRGHSATDTERAFFCLRAHGLRVILQMMTGLPGSCPESDYGTAERIAELHPAGVRIYPTVVVRDTPLYARYEAGTYCPETVEEAAILCAKLYRLFRNAGIPVLRMGLQPTTELDRGGAVAGPYHPSFGELVKSRLYYEQACAILRQTNAKAVTLLVRKDRLSVMIGQHRSNLVLLQQEFPEKMLKIMAGDCEEWEIRLQLDENPDTIT